MESIKEKRVTVIFTEDEHKKFKIYASELGKSMSDIIREVVGEMTSETITTRYKLDGKN